MPESQFYQPFGYAQISHPFGNAYWLLKVATNRRAVKKN
jgi:hypothetical protein